MNDGYAIAQRFARTTRLLLDWPPSSRRHGRCAGRTSGRPLHETLTKFERWCEVVAQLRRRQTRVLTWPAVTVFVFIAVPNEHFFLRPRDMIDIQSFLWVQGSSEYEE